MFHVKHAALAAALLFALPAFGHDYRAGDIVVDHPWSRATPPGADVAGGYMGLRNEGEAADRLVSATTPAASRVEIHQMQMSGDVAQMRELEDGLTLDPGADVAFEPGGYHLMLVGLSQPLVEDQRVPLTLTFERAGTVEVELAVEAMGAGGVDHGAH